VTSGNTGSAHWSRNLEMCQCSLQEFIVSIMSWFRVFTNLVAPPVSQKWRTVTQHDVNVSCFIEVTHRDLKMTLREETLAVSQKWHAVASIVIPCNEFVSCVTEMTQRDVLMTEVSCVTQVTRHDVNNDALWSECLLCNRNDALQCKCLCVTEV
jgi:hypothetical protein